MSWEGKKVRYKTGRGAKSVGVATVESDTGTHVKLRTANGKLMTRKVEQIIGEYTPEPAHEELPEPLGF